MASRTSIASGFWRLSTWAQALTVVAVMVAASSMLHRLQADEPPAAGAHEAALVEFLPALSASEKRIVAALDEPTNLDAVEMPLQDVVDFLKDQHSIEIQLDGKALEEAGIGSDAPVTRHIKGISLRSALRLLFEPMDLTAIVHDDVLQVTTKEKADQVLITRVYPVRDLVEGTDYQVLADVMTTIVAPAAWSKVGGPGDIAIVKTAHSLAISQSMSVHDEILELLRALRAARKLSTPQANGK
jgi:hypothetical protein